MPGPVRLMVFEGFGRSYGAFGVLTRPLLKRGSTGPAVVEAQDALMQILQRSFRFGADGQFGSETERAVREVQQQFGLRVDGEIGKDTWTLLLGQEVQVGSGSGVGTPSSPPLVTPAPPTQNDGDIPVGNTPPPSAGGAGKFLIAAALIGGAFFLTRRK